MRFDKAFITSAAYVPILASVLTLGSAGIASAAHHEGDSTSGHSEVVSDFKDRPGMGAAHFTGDRMNPPIHSVSAGNSDGSNDGEIVDNIKNRPGMGDESIAGDATSAESERGHDDSRAARDRGIAAEVGLVRDRPDMGDDSMAADDAG